MRRRENRDLSNVLSEKAHDKGMGRGGIGSRALRAVSFLCPAFVQSGGFCCALHRRDACWLSWQGGLGDERDFHALCAGVAQGGIQEQEILTETCERHRQYLRALTLASMFASLVNERNKERVMLLEEGERFGGVGR